MDSEKMIRKLYINLVQELDDTDEINREMKKELLELLEEEKRQLNEEEYGRYRDKVFRAALVAEESGFVRGFRYAFRLFLECMEK